MDPKATSEALERAVRALPELPAHDGAHVHTAGVLRELARAWPSRPEGARRAALDALCRKLSLGRPLLTRYATDWKPAAPSEPLSPAGWEALLVVLLAHAAPPGSPTGDERGVALECLNAALTAIDRAEREGVAIDLGAWRSRSEALLDALPEQAT